MKNIRVEVMEDVMKAVNDVLNKHGEYEMGGIVLLFNEVGHRMGCTEAPAELLKHVLDQASSSLDNGISIEKLIKGKH